MSDTIFIDELKQLDMFRPEGEPTNLYFVAARGNTQDPHIRIALDKAHKYEADAVFFRVFPEDSKRSPLPQVYIYNNTTLSLNDAEYAERHRRLWNAGVVPLVFILTARQVKILNCRQEPKIDKDSLKPIYTPFKTLEMIVSANQAFAAREIAAGTLWGNAEFKKDFILDNTAYYKLLSHLKSFRRKLIEKKILSAPTINRILVMAMLVKYLNDRQDSAGNRVFEKGFFRRFSRANTDDLESLFREKGGCVRLFNHLSEHFNGRIFELTDNEKTELAQADLSFIADFLKGDQYPGGQLLFWPLYSFEDLPVELISNIYEEFLAKNDPKSKGIVYTPPMLVDFLLDQCLPLSTETLSWKILDPACGSGVFLVGAFKRLIQCWRIANNWEQPTHLDLKTILKNSIFGVDVKDEAVLITVFSLCVALCDELEPLVIWNDLKFEDLRKHNLQARDFFEIVESGEFENHFDLVIGNPPFDSILTTDAANRVEKLNAKNRPKLPDTQLALLFLEQSFRLARTDAAVCLIQPAGPLLYNGKALEFRGYLFERFAINQVLDFTPLEGTLFSKAQVAAAAVIGNNSSVVTDKILHLTFRRTMVVKEKLLFELDPYDFHWINRKTVSKNQYGWKANLLGGGRLHRLLDRLLNKTPTLGEYLKQKRKNEGWQYAEGYNVGCGSDLNELPNAKELADLPPDELSQHFKPGRISKLAPWITGRKNVPPEALTEGGIDFDKVKRCEELFFERPRKDAKEIFESPHVLIREVVDGLAIPAVFSDEELVFSKQIIGIHAPRHDEKKLRNVAEYLNNSGCPSFLAAVVSTRMLVSRRSSVLTKDILSLPYAEDMNFSLCDWEKALIEDVMKYQINFQCEGEEAAILTRTEESDLRNFGEMYCSVLNPVYKQFRPLEPISLDSFICYPFCYGEVPKIEMPAKDKVVPYIREILQRQHSSRLFVNRILRIYEQNVIFMIKPDQKRYWLRSIALRDADETLVDLLEQGY